MLFRGRVSRLLLPAVPMMFKRLLEDVKAGKVDRLLATRTGCIGGSQGPRTRPGGDQSEVVQRGKVLGEGVDNALSVSVVSCGDLQNDGLDAGSGEIRQAGGHVRGFADE